MSLIAALFVGLLNHEVDEDDFDELCAVASELTRKHIKFLRKMSATQPVLATEVEVPFVATHGLIIQDFAPHGEGYGPRYRLSQKGSVLPRVLARTPWWVAQ